MSTCNHCKMPKVCIHCLPEERQILSINITALERIAEYFFQAGIEASNFSKEKRTDMLNTFVINFIKEVN